MKFVNISMIIMMIFLWLVTSAAAPAILENRDKKKTEDLYQIAKESVYRNDWTAAVKQLGQVVEALQGREKFDESLYWLGYSLNRLAQTLENPEKILGLQEQALTRLKTLIERFPTSPWVDDARLLRVEIAGNLVSKGFNQFKQILNGASQDQDTEMKLAALDALLRMDGKKAFLRLERMIRESQDPRLRRKAIYVISQTSDDRVIPLLTEVITKDRDRKTREKAIFWLGQRGGEEALKQLLKLYKAIADVELKGKIIFALAQIDGDKGVKEMIKLYRGEKSLELKKKIIFWMGSSHSNEAREFIEKILLE